MEMPQSRQRAFTNAARISNGQRGTSDEDFIDVEFYKQIFMRHFADKTQQKRMTEIAIKFGKERKGKLNQVEFEKMIKHIQERMKDKRDPEREVYEEIYRDG